MIQSEPGLGVTDPMSEMPSRVSPEDVIAAALSNGNSQNGFHIDPEGLRAKYVAEREKRVNNGGTAQYQLVDEHASYDQDLYVEPGFTRDPINAEYDVVLVGCGYTSLQVAARLMENGYTNIAMIERGGDFGGTWSVCFHRCGPRSVSHATHQVLESLSRCPM